MNLDRWRTLYGGDIAGEGAALDSVSEHDPQQPVGVSNGSS
jgi:hypothetical protein